VLRKRSDAQKGCTVEGKKTARQIKNDVTLETFKENTQKMRPIVQSRRFGVVDRPGFEKHPARVSLDNKSIGRSERPTSLDTYRRDKRHDDVRDTRNVHREVSSYYFVRSYCTGYPRQPNGARINIEILTPPVVGTRRIAPIHKGGRLVNMQAISCSSGEFL